MLLKGAFLSSCGRFPIRGSAKGPGGNRYLRLFLTPNNHSRAKISPARKTVAEKSMTLFLLGLLDSTLLVGRSLLYSLKCLFWTGTFQWCCTGTEVSHMTRVHLHLLFYWLEARGEQTNIWLELYHNHFPPLSSTELVLKGLTWMNTSTILVSENPELWGILVVCLFLKWEGPTRGQQLQLD